MPQMWSYLNVPIMPFDNTGLGDSSASDMAQWSFPDANQLMMPQTLGQSFNPATNTMVLASGMVPHYPEWTAGLQNAFNPAPAPGISYDVQVEGNARQTHQSPVDNDTGGQYLTPVA